MWVVWWPGVTIGGRGAAFVSMPGAMSVGRDENLFCLRAAGGDDVRTLLEGVVVVLIACRVVPGETLIVGSGGGGPLVSCPS